MTTRPDHPHLRVLPGLPHDVRVQLWDVYGDELPAAVYQEHYARLHAASHPPQPADAPRVVQNRAQRRRREKP